MLQTMELKGVIRSSSHAMMHQHVSIEIRGYHLPVVGDDNRSMSTLSATHTSTVVMQP